MEPDNPLPTTQDKLLQYISNGINTLLIAALIYLGTTVQSNSQTLIRVEEGLKTIGKVIEIMQPKIDTAYDTSRQSSQELINLKERINKLETQKYN